MKRTHASRFARLTALLLSLCLLAGMMPAAVFAEAPKVTPGDACRTTRTEAVVEFTSDTTGTYYYTVIKLSEVTGTPTIDTSGAGSPCTANQKVTLTVDNLTTDEYLFFVQVKSTDNEVGVMNMVQIIH